MGFSRSSNGNQYKSGNNGSNYYQKKGFFGNLFDMVASRGGSGGQYRNQPNQMNQGNQYNNSLLQNQPGLNQNAVSCTKCRAQIPSGSKFCLQCGEAVKDALFCLGCGEKLPLDAKFCMKCGQKVN
jgi:ribosomal protein L40E